MEELETSNLLNIEETIAKDIFKNKTYPWEVLPDIGEFILKLGNMLDTNKFNKIDENIWVAKNCKIDKTSYIIGPCIIDENAELRHCSYIRGNVIIGKNSVIRKFYRNKEFNYI